MRDEDQMQVYEEGARARLAWESENEADVEKARDYFMKLTKQCWIAARKDGELKRVLEFKPEYGELWFMPITEGG